MARSSHKKLNEVLDLSILTGDSSFHRELKGRAVLPYEKWSFATHNEFNNSIALSSNSEPGTSAGSLAPASVIGPTFDNFGCIPWQRNLFDPAVLFDRLCQKIRRVSYLPSTLSNASLKGVIQASGQSDRTKEIGGRI
jgi:hypothetical protein